MGLDVIMLLVGRLGRCVFPLFQKALRFLKEERGNVIEVRIFPTPKPHLNPDTWWHCFYTETPSYSRHRRYPLLVQVFELSVDPDALESGNSSRVAV
jgi:hypothetical protein